MLVIFAGVRHTIRGMSRLRRIERNGRHFFVTAHVARGVSPFTAEERNFCLTSLSKTRAKHRFHLFAYVVMPDHAHLLVQIFDSDLPAIVRDWKRESAFAIGRARKTTGALWQARYFDFILRRARDFAEKFEYIHQNPVAAGLVERPEDWRWSSCAFYARAGSVMLEPDVFDRPVDGDAPLWPAPWR